MANRKTATMGEESESEEEEESFDVAPTSSGEIVDGTMSDLTADQIAEDGNDDTPNLNSNQSNDLASPTPNKPKPGYVTWRHKSLRERNRSVRKQYLGRVCSIPKAIAQKLKELGPQLSRHQQVAQDASDSLQVLRDDMSNLQLKLADMLQNTEFIPPLHIPCLILRNIKVDEIEQKLPLIKSLPESVRELQCGPQARIKFLIHKFAVNSEVQFRFKPSAAENGDSAGSSVDVFESFRDVAMLHKPFFDKTYASILALLSQLPELTPALVEHNAVVPPVSTPSASEIEVC